MEQKNNTHLLGTGVNKINLFFWLSLPFISYIVGSAFTRLAFDFFRDNKYYYWVLDVVRPIYTRYFSPESFSSETIYLAQTLGTALIVFAVLVVSYVLRSKKGILQYIGNFIFITAFLIAVAKILYPLFVVNIMCGGCYKNTGCFDYTCEVLRFNHVLFTGELALWYFLRIPILLSLSGQITIWSVNREK